jgi:hypothetical protein
MAPKKLSPSAINPRKLLGGSSFAKKTANISDKLKEESVIISKGDLLTIKSQVFEIKNLVTNLTSLKNKKIRTQRTETEKEKFGERERELEKKKKPEDNKIKLPQSSKLGFLDIVKRFVVNTLIGFAVVRLIKHLPKLIEVAKFAGGTMDFITDVGGKLLNGLATFIQKGYEAYDFTRNTLKSFGGNNALKLFDGFNNALGGIVTAALAASFALFDMAGGGKEKGVTRIKPNKGSRSIDPKVAKRYTEIYGKDAAKQRFGKKSVLKFTRPLLKRLPIIGAVLDFGLSVALGEDPGRAAFKAIGAGLLGTIGAALGGPFAILTGLAGGVIGDAAGASLYDLFFGNKKPNQKVAKAAGGGQPVTRGGKVVSGPRRTITRQKAKRTVSVKSTQLKPGADIGGEKNIEKVFPKSKDKSQVSPLGYIEKSYKNTAQDRLFGPLLNLQTKSLVGQKPNKVDYANAAQGLSNWMTLTFSDEILRTGAVYAAGGGEINADMLSKKSGDITDAIARSLEYSISKRMDDNIKDLMKQMMLKQPSKPAGVPGMTKPEDQNLIDIQGGDADFWTLVAVASREDGDPQSWADVAQSVYNRLASGAYSGKTIKDLILGQMQYEPTWKFPNGATRGTGKPNPEWYQIKDAASAGVATGQSADAMKKVAAALLDPTLQKNAREFIQGRTDFRGYSVGGGVQRKSGDNYFGWYNNYTANKIGSVPNFGATITTGGPGPGMMVPFGTGKVGAVDQFTPIAQRFGLQVTSAYRSGDPGYHGKNMARDYQTVGAPGNSGTQGQMQFAQYLIKNYGSSLKQLIYTPLGFGISNGKKVGLDEWGPSTNSIHYDHVHVAFFHGGLAKKTGLHMLHKGEFVVDADSVNTVGKSFIATINSIENQSQLKQKVGSLINHLSYIAGYEPGGQQEIEVEPEIVYIEVEKVIPVPISSAGYSVSSSGEDYSQALYAQG